MVDVLIHQSVIISRATGEENTPLAQWAHSFISCGWGALSEPKKTCLLPEYTSFWIASKSSGSFRVGLQWRCVSKAWPHSLSCAVQRRCCGVTDQERFGYFALAMSSAISLVLICSITMWRFGWFFAILSERLRNSLSARWTKPFVMCPYVSFVTVVSGWSERTIEHSAIASKTALVFGSSGSISPLEPQEFVVTPPG